MKHFQSHKWVDQIHSTFPEIQLKKWENLSTKLLFPKGSSRAENTLIAEFIHGHSLRFGNFRKSIGIDDCDLCEHCGVMADSPEHQLFECENLECTERQELLVLLNHNIGDFKWNITTSNLTEDQEHAVKLFADIVHHIEQEYEIIMSGYSTNSL